MAGVLTRHRPRRRRDLLARCTCGIVNGDCEGDKKTAPRCSGSAGAGWLLFYAGCLRRSVCFWRSEAYPDNGFPSRLSQVVLLALMVRLAVDEPSIPLKDREGTISTPFRKIFAIICLSPVFSQFSRFSIMLTWPGPCKVLL
jgi:hypothetical protein